MIVLAGVYRLLRRMPLSFPSEQFLPWRKPASHCCNHNTVFVTALSVKLSHSEIYFWVFVFILSIWTVLHSVRKVSFFLTDILAVENVVK